jgi:hypothetical protein
MRMRRADVVDVSAWEPPCRGIGIAKILKKLQLHPRQGSHSVDVGYKLTAAEFERELIRAHAGEGRKPRQGARCSYGRPPNDK